ncbi:hypothetical protein [Marinomonas profundi]|nr:hypothetical protein [Marinomonas profundi]
MESTLTFDILHLCALAITTCCFLIISGKRVIELCSQTDSSK